MLLSKLRNHISRADTGAGGPFQNGAPDGNRITTISDSSHSYSFSYRNNKEKRRAQRLLDKEPGTIAWLERELRPGDVFYDVGANIGVYTIFAAVRIGAAGKIYAFEPHIPNAASLMENIFINGASQKVTLVSSPLTEREHYDVFNYQSVLPASSTSQFGRNSYEGVAFEPTFKELKFGTTIDTLVDKGLIEPPNLIKIDVDGLDFEVLAGMRRLLSGANRPRSIQAELGSDSKAKIMHLCAETGYRLKEKHWTKAGQQHIDAGNDPEDYPHYGIFSAS
jgi:FkbM family methyltransferase